MTGDHEHGDRAAAWPGFSTEDKTRAGLADEPCEQCADGRCPRGSGLKLMAYRARLGELIRRHGYDVNAAAERHPHGVDLRCVAPDGETVWVWEFARTADVAQARANLAHLLGRLRANGVRAEAGPPFDEVPVRSYPLGRDGLVRVRSAPEHRGVELLEVLACRTCWLADSWVYPEADRWNQRGEDACEMHRQADGEPNGRPAGDDAVRVLASFPPGTTDIDAALRHWFTAALPLGEFGGGEKPGDPVGTLRLSPDERVGVRLTAEVWPRFLARLAEDTPEPRLWLGRVNEYSVVSDMGYTAELLAHAVRHRNGGWSLRLGGPRLGAARARDLLRDFAERFPVGYAEITPAHRLGWETLFERLLYRDPVAGVAQPATLRGYGWVTVGVPEIGERLASGRHWLQATPSYETYDESAAEAVRRRVRPALPPGMPARSGLEPHLIMMG
ncbi:hypothetical protein [Actinoplanes sp. RD1]|uniref:hypothetical protein n=1 Tax=Actinoplanes sp. RD1 TaxID=3064538 RepID=UPI0027422EE0|nr:hypothetical protein [Actinoplanes sp. RD1]